MKKRPILNAYEMKLFKEWIADGNAVENEKGVWLEQTTQYRKKFTYEELQKFFKNEFLMYKGGGSAKNLLSSRADKVAKKEKSLNLKAYNVPSVPYEINPLNEGLDEIFQDIVGKDELREAMSGVDFVENTATGTDAIKLLHLVGKREGKFKDGNYYLFSTMENEWSKNKILSKEMSVAEYYKQRSLIDQRFPNWIAVVYDSFDYKQEFNLPTLYDIVNSLVVSKLLNKEYYGIIIEFKTKDGAYEIGFNAKNLRNLIKSLIMAGITDATGYFNAPSRGVTILDSSLKFPNKNKRDEFFMENSFGLVMPIMIPDEETLEEKRKEGLRMAEWDNLVYEFPVIRVISPNEYELEIYGQDTLTYSRGKGIKIGTKSTTKSTPKETPKATPKTTDKKTALGNKLRKGMVVRIEYKESNGSTISYDLFFDKGDFIEYLLITDKKGKEIVETEEIITEKELNEKYTDLSEFIIAEFYETKEDGGKLMASGGQMELFVGGGRAVRPSMFEVYQVTDKMRRSMYLNDNELQKFLNDWNEDYDTDYEDWSEFNQYENEVNITPIFSKNDDGGYVDKFNYPVAVFKLEEINVDEKNKDKPLITNQEGIDLFIDRWNDRLGKNYKNWREFNKGEKNLRITPVFSSNEMGGDVDFEEVQINDIANWENEEIANYLDLTTEEVAKNRQKYVRLAQNELMLSGVDSYDDGGGVGLSQDEISIIDDRISYYFDNEGYTDDSELLASFVIEGGEIDSSKYNQILEYIDSQKYKKGGEAGFDDTGTSMAMYHEKQGNWLVPKGQVYLWLYDVENSAEKIESEEFDFVQYPLTSMSMAFQRGHIPPLKIIWTKKFQKEHKGSEHLLGVIKAYLIEKEGKKELYIDMMSVNPKKKKKGIMSYMIKDLRDTFDLRQDQITFSQLTKEGEKFVGKKTYADGGKVGSIKIGDEVYGRWNDGNKWTLGTYKGETENGFEVYDFTIEKPDHIEFYAEISKNPYPYFSEKDEVIFKSKNWKERNYKNYHFNKYADGGGVDSYAKGGTVIASSPTLEGIKKLISEYLYGSTITLVQIDDDGEFFEVHNKKGITPFYVKLKNNKYQFVPSQDNYSRGGTLDKKYNFNDFGIKSYRELIDRNEFVSKFKSVNNSSDFDRIKFNRMRGEEQLKYVQRLNKQVNKYNLTLRDGSFYEVSKEIFDYADIPETETKNYYTKFDEPSGYIWKKGGSLKRKSNDLGEYYDKYVNGGFVGGDIIKFKYNGKDFTRKVESVDEMGNAIVNLMKSEKATINPADIFDIKKEFTEKDVIIKKIGLSEENADFLISLSPTFAVWLADSIVELTTKSNLYGSRAETIKALNESPYLVAQFRERIRGILDWLQHPSTPKQNLRELSFAEAEKKSEEWHKELSTSGGDIDYTEPKENIILKKYAPNEFGITYYWVFIPKSKCDIEGKRMGHCGTTGASSLISLRSVRAYTESSTITDSHVTVAYDIQDAKFYQGKAKKNAKPSQKYFPYIFDLIESLANGDINKEYQKELQEKTADLQIEKSILEEKQEKLIKYFQSEKAKKENVESLVEKANNLIEIKEKIQETNQKINQIALDINFDFNGFGCEYKCENDYGWEDMTNEQIKELYELKPELFNDFAGQYMLYEIGLIDKQPNTIVTIEKPVEYVADLLSLDRDLSDDFVEKVLTGDTYEWFDGSDSWRYFYDNAGDYVDDLKKADYDAVLDKIVEITGLDKEIVEENGAKHYLDGDDEEFDADNFDDIKRAIVSALEGAERSSYENYYYEQIENALSELGTIKKLDDTGVEIEVDLKDLIGISAISGYMKNLDSENLEDVFFEAQSNGDFSLPDLSIDDRYIGDTDNWQDGFDIDNYAVGGAVYPDLSMQKPQVVNDSIQLAEFELKQPKELTTINNIKNQKILSSGDAVDIFRQIWEKDTINANEQAYVLFLNKNNKPKGFYHHSSGGIDGTIMDVQMICGMAIKSLSKGVIIAHNHPSQNTQPSDADKRITQQLKEALKLFNIQLLDSLILTENSSLSFADEGIL